MKPTTHARPVLLADVSRTIRLFGEIWHINYENDFALFRASIGPQQLRVFVPRPNATVTEVPPDKGAPGFIVRDLIDLENWLLSFVTDDALPFGPPPSRS